MNEFDEVELNKISSEIEKIEAELSVFEKEIESLRQNQAESQEITNNTLRAGAGLIGYGLLAEEVSFLIPGLGLLAVATGFFYHLISKKRQKEKIKGLILEKIELLKNKISHYLTIRNRINNEYVPYLELIISHFSKVKLPVQAKQRHESICQNLNSPVKCYYKSLKLDANFNALIESFNEHLDFLHRNESYHNYNMSVLSNQPIIKSYEENFVRHYKNNISIIYDKFYAWADSDLSLQDKNEKSLPTEGARFFLSDKNIIDSDSRFKKLISKLRGKYGHAQFRPKLFFGHRLLSLIAMVLFAVIGAYDINYLYNAHRLNNVGTWLKYGAAIGVAVGLLFPIFKGVDKTRIGFIIKDDINSIKKKKGVKPKTLFNIFLALFFVAEILGLLLIFDFSQMVWLGVGAWYIITWPVLLVWHIIFWIAMLIWHIILLIWHIILWFINVGVWIAVGFWHITKWIFNGLGGQLSIWKIIHIILAGIYSIFALIFLIFLIGIISAFIT